MLSGFCGRLLLLRRLIGNRRRRRAQIDLRGTGWIKAAYRRASNSHQLLDTPREKADGVIFRLRCTAA